MPIQLIKLRQIADARSGDKGSSSNIGIIAHDEKAYHFLEKYLTAERVQDYFSSMGVLATQRYELPNLLALNFILNGILKEGGSRSLRLDAQGKALGQVLLEMDIEFPTETLVTIREDSLILIDYPEKDVAVLTLNRPSKHNALNIQMLSSLCAQLTSFVGMADLRVLIINAAGMNFCAGMDLQEAMDLTLTDRSAELISRMLQGLSEAHYVTIAAVQGIAAGGGAGILSACDLVVATDTVSISYPETKRGLIPAQVAPFLQRLLPYHLLNELLILGNSLSPEQALAFGLVNRVVPNENLMAEAYKMAAMAKKGAPEAIKQTKELLRALRPRSFKEEQQITLPYHHHSRKSKEAMEGMQAFKEKRNPYWIE